MSLRPTIGGVLLALAVAARAFAQADVASYPASGRLGVGGELSVSFAPKDDEGFFNYTDYARDALRVARLRLFAEWRFVPAVSLISEVRTENGDSVDVAAAYVRWRPSANHDVYVQAGRIPPVVGAFARRAYGRDNLVIGLPLAYQYLTSLRPDALPATLDDVAAMRARGWQPTYPIGEQTYDPGIPLISSSRWDTGVEVRSAFGDVEMAAAVTLGSPAVPVVRETNRGRQWSGRLAWNAPFGLVAGVSAARGAWIEQRALDLIPASGSRASAQRLVAVDMEYGYGRWLVRGEAVRTTFDLPLYTTTSAQLAATAVFVEARYRVHPRWQIAARVDRLGFGTLAESPWDAPVKRVETVLAYRATRTLDLRAGVQADWRDGGRVRRKVLPVVQALFWF